MSEISLRCQYCGHMFTMGGTGPMNLDWHNCTEKGLSLALKNYEEIKQSIDRINLKLDAMTATKDKSE